MVRKSLLQTVRNGSFATHLFPDCGFEYHREQFAPFGIVLVSEHAGRAAGQSHEIHHRVEWWERGVSKFIQIGVNSARCASIAIALSYELFRDDEVVNEGVIAQSPLLSRDTESFLLLIAAADPSVKNGM